MPQTAKAIPDGHRTVTPYLIVADGTAAIAFYVRAFGAREVMRFEDGGKIGHAEIEIGDSKIMLADEYPEMDIYGPRHYRGTPVTIHLWVDDADAVTKRAVNAGAKIARPVQDQFYGDRSGSVEDPFGHVWHISTHKEDLSIEEMRQRMAAAPKKS